MKNKHVAQRNTKGTRTKLLLVALIGAATAEALQCIYWGIKVFQATSL